MASRRRSLLLLLAAALARPSAGLRVGEQPAAHFSSRTTAEERAAREAGTCGKGAAPLDFARHEGAEAECDELIPRYDMQEWVQRHGWVVPDHPAVFVNTGTHEAQVFPTMEVFMEQHGDESVVALPEYAQSGGHLKDPGAGGKIQASFRDLAKVWNDTFVYLSDFKCAEGSLCETSSRSFGAPALFATSRFQSKNFLVGGPDSGLPFHKHGMTWQGLSMGRKAWYVLPPGSMSEQMHDETGPYLYPVRAYHGSMLSRTVGQRPLYCVQRPGEVFYVPDFWWHATMNLDRFQVAYGEKPGDKAQQEPRSETLSKMLGAFPPQAWDRAGYSSKAVGGPTGTEEAMPFALQPRGSWVQETCGRDVDVAGRGLEEPLRRLRAMAGSPVMTCGAAETAAFAHCEMARLVGRVSNSKNCSLDHDAVQALKDRGQRWVEEAEKLSPALVAREPKICRKK